MILRALIFVLLLAGVAEAQQARRPVDLKLIGGWTTFLDESNVDHAVAGAAVRFYVTRKLSIEPEFLYMWGPRDDHDMSLIPHVAYDFGSNPRIVPYVIGGAGLFRHWDSFLPEGSTEWTA